VGEPGRSADVGGKLREGQAGADHTIAYGPDADQETLAKIARVTKEASYKAPSAADIPTVSAALSNL